MRTWVRIWTLLPNTVEYQMGVHKTLYCFYTTKKILHESTRSIRIYFEIFFKWSL